MYPNRFFFFFSNPTQSSPLLIFSHHFPLKPPSSSSLNTQEKIPHLLSHLSNSLSYQIAHVVPSSACSPAWLHHNRHSTSNLLYSHTHKHICTELGLITNRDAIKKSYSGGRGKNHKPTNQTTPRKIATHKSIENQKKKKTANPNRDMLGVEGLVRELELDLSMQLGARQLSSLIILDWSPSKLTKRWRRTSRVLSPT